MYKNSLTVLFSEWPILTHVKAADIIESDFSILNLTSVILGFPVLAKFLRELRKIRPLHARDIEAARFIGIFNSEFFYLLEFSIKKITMKVTMKKFIEFCYQ
uniref:Uncharacterized protein n=1 Tax=Fopius arisanus TaxID=64838 RepID=A0A0C9RLN5_9HYME